MSDETNDVNRPGDRSDAADAADAAIPVPAAAPHSTPAEASDEVPAVAETTDVDTPDVDSPDVDTTDADTTDVDTPDVDTPDADTPDAEASGGEPTEASAPMSATPVDAAPAVAAKTKRPAKAARPVKTKRPAKTEPSQPAPRASTAGRTSGAARMGGRIVVGVLAAAAVAALAVGAAVVVPLTGVVAVVPAVTATPAVGETTLTCSPTLFALGRDIRDASKITVADATTLTVSPADAARTELPISSVPDANVLAVAAAPTAEGTTDLSGIATASPTQEDMTGFAAAACRPALSEAWLVGADTRTGSVGVVVLANPAAVAATVTLTVYGVAGPQPGTTSVTLPARTSTALSLAGLVGSETSPVIHVRSEGAPVTAQLQSTMVQGLAPTGVDVQDVVRAAATTQVMPGVPVTATAGGVPTTSVRLLAPDRSTTATVSVRAEGGSQAVLEQPIELVAGIPGELPLSDLAAGTYDVTVTADAPLVAATWQATGRASGDDCAWFPAAPAVGSDALFQVAAGVPATLHLANVGDTDAAVKVAVAAGEQSVTVPAHGAVAVPVSAGSARLTTDDGSEQVYGSVTYAQAKRLAAVPVWPTDIARAPIVVTR
ncbi:DUF5719 family protein [Microbacterium gorillae]|uniref:DUF5719 family protein n=1 Tax=Microbacterium gorillae TaxID=1231063 RepID=UPI00058FDBD9|nr:DUF5719 family protein [Microbacterium gorillae]